MTAALSHAYVSLEEFLGMDPEAGTWLEWCAGRVHAMSGGSPEHSRLCARMIALLSKLAGPDCTVFDAKADLWVEEAQFYGQADASVVCGALHTHSVRRGDRVLGEAITNPTLLVEVLSPSTEARDRGEKFEIVRRMRSLEQYVLVAQDERRVEVRQRERHGWSTIVATAGESITLLGKEPFDVLQIYEGA